MAKRLPLLAKLFEYPNLKVRDWAKREHKKLQNYVQRERESESKKNKEKFERF